MTLILRIKSSSEIVYENNKGINAQIREQTVKSELIREGYKEK